MNRQLSGALQAALVWLVGRVIIWSAIIAGAIRHDVDPARRSRSPLEWIAGLAAQFDGIFYTDIAANGYQARSDPCCSSAFFPGYPMTIRAVSTVTGISIDVSALLVSLVASLVAAVLLYHLVARSQGPRVALIAVAFFSFNPMAVFLGVSYSEPLFLALVLAGWLAAKSDRWALAALLIGLSMTVRVPGGLAAAALVVMALSGGRSLRAVARLWPMALGVLLLALWTWNLHAVSGHWDAWHRAEKEAWGRAIAWPWVGFTTWLDDMRGAESLHLMMVYLGELAAVVVILALTVDLARRRRGPETLYVGGNAFLMTFTSMWMSAPRYAMICFPVYERVAELTADRRTARWLLLAASSVLALANAYAWGSGWWVA